jgi:hypothetical protein
MTIFRSSEERKRDVFQAGASGDSQRKEHNIALMLQILSPFSEDFFSYNTCEK